MNKFCTNCGAAKEDDGQKLCSQCLSQAEAATTASPSAVNSRMVEQNAAIVGRWAKQAAVAPREAMGQAVAHPNAIPGIALAVASSIWISLIGMLVLRKIWMFVFQIFDFGSGFPGMSLLGAFSFPYGRVFFSLLLLMLVQWFLLALILMGISGWFQSKLSLIQSLNVVGVAKLYLAASLTLSWLCVYIYSPLAIAVLLGGTVAGYISIDQSVRHLHPSTSTKSSQFYFIPVLLVIYFVVEFILLKILF